MLALHHLVPTEKKFWTHAAVLLAVVYTTYNTLNYVVQLVTVIPAGYSWTFEDQQPAVSPTICGRWATASRPVPSPKTP
jgi:thiol:disulfide interchange protein